MAKRRNYAISNISEEMFIKIELERLREILSIRNVFSKRADVELRLADSIKSIIQHRDKVLIQRRKKELIQRGKKAFLDYYDSKSKTAESGDVESYKRLIQRIVLISRKPENLLTNAINSIPRMNPINNKYIKFLLSNILNTITHGPVKAAHPYITDAITKTIEIKPQLQKVRKAFEKCVIEFYEDMQDTSFSMSIKNIPSGKKNQAEEQAAKLMELIRKAVRNTKDKDPKPFKSYIICIAEAYPEKDFPEKPTKWLRFRSYTIVSAILSIFKISKPKAPTDPIADIMTECKKKIRIIAKFSKKKIGMNGGNYSKKENVTSYTASILHTPSSPSTTTIVYTDPTTVYTNNQTEARV